MTEEWCNAETFNQAVCWLLGYDLIRYFLTESWSFSDYDLRDYSLDI